MPLDEDAAGIEDIIAAHRNLHEKIYRIEVVELENGQFYWHLFIRASGQRVNGGMDKSKEDARRTARRACAFGSHTTYWDKASDDAGFENYLITGE